MAKDTDRLAGTLETEHTGGLLSGLLAEENEFDSRTLWRLGTCGVASVGAVIVAVLANQSSLGWRRDLTVAADITRQAQEMQILAKEGQNEARRLASAIETLNNDRDRLYSRVTVLEQGLDSVTGTIARQNSAAALAPTASKPSAPTEMPPPQSQPAAPAVTPVATAIMAKTDQADKARPDGPAPTAEAAATPTVPAQPTGSNPPAPAQATPATPLIAAKSMMAPPDPAAAKLVEPEKPSAKAEIAPPPAVTASVTTKQADAPEAAPSEAASPKLTRTEFAVDVGTANSIGGLRALWRGLVNANSELAALRPIIVIRESNTGLGMQLHLAAGPLSDAAAAAKICAALIESQRACETTVFDGQRLAMKADEAPPPAAVVKPVANPYRRSFSRRAKRDDPPAPKPEPSTLSSLFGKR
jgi:hypothetical protein